MELWVSLGVEAQSAMLGKVMLITPRWREELCGRVGQCGRANKDFVQLWYPNVVINRVVAQTATMEPWGMFPISHYILMLSRSNVNVSLVVSVR